MLISRHHFLSLLALLSLPAIATSLYAQDPGPPPSSIAKFFQPPAEFAGKLSPHRSPLLFKDGREVKTPEDWAKRRAEIRETWESVIGKWPAVIEHPKLEKLETKQRENFMQHRIRLEIGPGQTGMGYLLVPEGKGPFPAVFVPYYDPETSAGLTDKPLRDFAYQLTKRGFVSLCIGSPGGDARKPVLGDGVACQPLHYLGYICANAWQALADLPEVDSKRIGVVGHSYGGKWSMFGSCFWDKYACAVWSDGGVVFDEARPSVNYWEPWYLGLDAKLTRKPGLITKESPRTGAYTKLVEQGMDLQELHALMAPRPFLVSGGSEDFPARWMALNHAVAVNKLLGYENRVAMTNRPDHSPNEESNAQVYAFFEWWLKPGGK
ncbi:sialidase [Roseimicrobium sp. ORNL1]|uniref:alpha/beta hydrolase family protein n=1 Tax=Roseimicrobium sp. ORNL1 TaxID=2711231 RepID=UPI0013E1ACAA|nr:sialidase [Roseimicrobium sp. ORNL1]QIF00557.1 sialidase [Roseimicrobium sp. ORNL1]